jgi:hypothetical protein
LRLNESKQEALIDKTFGGIDLTNDDVNLFFDAPWASQQRADKGNLVVRPADSELLGGSSK